MRLAEEHMWKYRHCVPLAPADRNKPTIPLHVKMAFSKPANAQQSLSRQRQGDSGGGVVIVRGPGTFIRRSAQYTLFGILVATTICEAT